MISFAAAWVLRSWWDGRRADYRDPGNGYQQCVGPRPPRRSGPDTRYALGWSAFQLRHGWPAMIEDVRRGYGDAQSSFKAWREGDESARHGMWDAWKHGWREAYKKLPKTRRQQQKANEAASDAAPETPAGGTADRVVPVPVPPRIPMIGESMTTPIAETNSITAYREHLNHTIREAYKRIESALAAIRGAEEEISGHELSHASLSTAGMGAETTGDVAELIEAAMARKSAAESDFAAAEKARTDAERALASLDAQGHTSVEEAVKSASAQVADTSFYKN